MVQRLDQHQEVPEGFREVDLLGRQRTSTDRERAAFSTNMQDQFREDIEALDLANLSIEGIKAMAWDCYYRGTNDGQRLQIIDNGHAVYEAEARTKQ